MTVNSFGVYRWRHVHKFSCTDLRGPIVFICVRVTRIPNSAYAHRAKKSETTTVRYETVRPKADKVSLICLTEPNKKW